MYVAIMREVKGRAEQVSSVKYCISGAAPLPAKVQEDFERLSGGKVVEGYGLSEASPVTHCNPLNENCVNGSIGLPLPNVDAMIMDGETGKRLPPGRNWRDHGQGSQYYAGLLEPRAGDLGDFPRWLDAHGRSWPYG